MGAIIPSKKLRNKIAGFITHLMKKSKKDQSVESLSNFKKKKEREETTMCLMYQLLNNIIEVDKDTKEMLKVLDFGNIAGLQVTEPFTGAAIRSSVPGMRSRTSKRMCK